MHDEKIASITFEYLLFRGNPLVTHPMVASFPHPREVASLVVKASRCLVLVLLPIGAISLGMLLRRIRRVVLVLLPVGAGSMGVLSREVASLVVKASPIRC